MGVIDVRNLRFTYAKARVPALDGLDFDIRRGEIFGFLGPNGAGKSTTQRILIGLLKGYQGSASAFGRAVADWGADYYERIGVCFEMPNHYLKLTGLENLAYFRSLYRVDTQTPEALLDSVGLAADRRMPVSQYSRGMKTRLSVARSLLNNPELIFLDEPTTGLDPVGAQRIRTLIRTQKANGRTVFLTTHDMTVADDLCDRVAFIVDGKIRLIDSPRAARIAHGAPTVRVEYRAGGRTERRTFPLEGLGRNEAFLALLRDHDIETVHTEEATLEDVFIRVTGRSLS